MSPNNGNTILDTDVHRNLIDSKYQLMETNQ